MKKKLWDTVPFRHVGGDALLFSSHREAPFPEFLTLSPNSWFSSYLASLTVVWRYAQEKQKSLDPNSCIVLRIFLGRRLLLQDSKVICILPLREIVIVVVRVGVWQVK